MHDSNEANEQRHNKRILFDTPVTVRFDTASWESSAIDVSLKGALIELPDNWKAEIGEKGHLHIQLGEQDISIEMEVSVAHLEGEHIGFHCDFIDIDSITHLRRLVELNLGDTALLERELANLHK